MYFSNTRKPSERVLNTIPRPNVDSSQWGLLDEYHFTIEDFNSSKILILLHTPIFSNIYSRSSMDQLETMPMDMGEIPELGDDDLCTGCTAMIDVLVVFFLVPHLCSVISGIFVLGKLVV